MKTVIIILSTFWCGDYKVIIVKKNWPVDTEIPTPPPSLPTPYPPSGAVGKS